jgi:hypothetical protein
MLLQCEYCLLQGGVLMPATTSGGEFKSKKDILVEESLLFSETPVDLKTPYMQRLAKLNGTPTKAVYKWVHRNCHAWVLPNCRPCDAVSQETACLQETGSCLEVCCFCGNSFGLKVTCRGV